MIFKFFEIILGRDPGRSLVLGLVRGLIIEYLLALTLQVVVIVGSLLIGVSTEQV